MPYGGDLDDAYQQSQEQVRNYLGRGFHGI